MFKPIKKYDSYIFLKDVATKELKIIFDSGKSVHTICLPKIYKDDIWNRFDIVKSGIANCTGYHGTIITSADDHKAFLMANNEFFSFDGNEVFDRIYWDNERYELVFVLNDLRIVVDIDNNILYVDDMVNKTLRFSNNIRQEYSDYVDLSHLSNTNQITSTGVTISIEYSIAVSCKADKEYTFSKLKTFRSSQWNI